MANCASDLQELDPSCAALKKKGGLKKRVWIGSYDVVVSVLNDSTGYIDGVSLVTASPVNKLFKYIGKKLKHNGAFEGQVGENTNVINQNLNLVLYAYTPDERAAIEKLFNSEELVAFVETEAGQIELWGYETGLTASALTGGSGTALNDSTAITITLSGQQDTLPKVVVIDDASSATSDLESTIAALDALT
jgi:hypothetical protein